MKLRPLLRLPVCCMFQRLSTVLFLLVVMATPTHAAKVFLGADDNFTVSNSGTTVYGNTGNNEVTIASGVTGVILDQNIERINLSGTASSYTFKQTGNLINVYDATGTTLIVKAPVQGDTDGTILSFSNGTASASVKLSGGVMKLGGITVTPGTATTLTPTTTASTPSTATTTKAKVFLGTDENFTVSNSGTTIYGNSGKGTVTIATETTGVILDQNVERINLSGASSSYTFKQTGNIINVYDATGTTLIVKAPVQGDTDGTVLAFSDGTASALLSGGVMSLGGATVSSSMASVLTPTTTSSTILISKSVASDGGMISVTDANSSLNGANVYIPPGVVQSSSNITIASVKNPPPISETQTPSLAVEFGPSGTTFKIPATITIPYDSTKITDESRVQVYTYDEIKRYWTTVKTTNIDTVNHTVTALVDHFSTYAAESPTTLMLTKLYWRSDNTLTAMAVISPNEDTIRTTSALNSFNREIKVPDFLSSCMKQDFAADQSTLQFKYTAKLMEYGTIWDSHIATKTITYTDGGIVNAADIDQLNVQISTDDSWSYGDKFFYAGPPVSKLFKEYYYGKPAMFVFNGFKHTPGEKYYVKVDLEVSTTRSNSFCVGDIFGASKSKTLTFDNIAERTSLFWTLRDIDYDENGIPNNYDYVTPGPPGPADTSPPNTPTGTKVTATSSSTIYLTWYKSTDSGTGVSGYNIYRNEGTFPNNSDLDKNFLWKFIPPSDTPTFNDSGLKPNTKYCYRITALDAARPTNESSHPELCATTSQFVDTTKPTTPQNLKVTTVSNGQINLAWTASTDDIKVAGYKIYRGGFFKSSTNGTTYSDVGLNSGTVYCYEVSAIDTSGNESTKNSAECAVTSGSWDPISPTIPTSLTATPVSQTQINLSWNASTDNVSVLGYHITRPHSGLGLIGFTASTSYSVTNLTLGTNYCFQVIAMDTVGNVSSFSDQACATTLSPPTYFISGQVTSNGIGLSGVTVSTSGGSATTDSSGNYTISGLANGSYIMTPSKTGCTFTPQTVTINNANVTLNFTATNAITLPSAPSGLTASAVSSSQINLYWTDNATDETGFKIERKTGSGSTYAQIGTAAANSTSYNDAGLTTSTAYYYQVRATNSVGDSGYSNEANTSTTASNGDSATITDPTTGMVLVKVTGGTYTMGDTFGDGVINELPTHQVTVSDFYIGKYEVTQGEWQTVMGSNPSVFKECGTNCPVETVSWNDIQTFITTLNQKSGTNYSLPTEAEWEYAARSGGNSEKYSGGSDVNAVAWYSSNSGYTTHPVGQKQANGLGLYDMSGNVWEWVSDSYGAYSSLAQTNPTGPTSTSDSPRVNRGGCWHYPAYYVSASFRRSIVPTGREYNVGFRLAAQASSVVTASNLSASAVSSSQINLTWADNASKETGYKIERKSGSNGTYAQIGTATANAISYNDTGLTASTTYYYKVRATSSVGDSQYSNEANATTNTTTTTTTSSFTDNGNGTVTENLTGLIWLKNANCTDTVAGIAKTGGTLTWANAVTWINGLASGACGLKDSSIAGMWRLPDENELNSVFHLEKNYRLYTPPYIAYIDSVAVGGYWSSSEGYSTNEVWTTGLLTNTGFYAGTGITQKSSYLYVWPVRVGQ